MAKISIAPNAAGTGIFTIQSPSGNTNRTLILPDSDGALATTSELTSGLDLKYDASNPDGFISGNETISITGDATGSGTTAISLTLADSGVSAGSYTSADLTVDAKGRITAISNGAGGNPFDQSLNTTDSVTFAKLGLGGWSGSSGAGLSVQSAATSSGPIVAKTTNYDTVWSILPWSNGETYISSGVYYNGNSWVHASANTTNCLFAIQGAGPRWYSSDNSSGSWNLASNVPLWNSAGRWVNDVTSPTDVRAPIFYVDGSSNNGRLIPNSSWGITCQTDNGYIQIGPANSTWAHLYTDRSNGFYTNVPITISNGTVLNTGDVRSALFYDKDDTGYYVNPAGTARLNTIYCGDVYNDLGGWFRNYSSTGLYNQTYGRGIWVSDAAGNSYGNFSTYGTGRNSWQGWGITNDFTYMGRDDTDHGCHNSGYGWAWYQTYAGLIGLGDSTTSGSYRVYVSGSLYATSTIVAYSDVRKKENIVTIPDALDKVKQMRGVFYNTIDDPQKIERVGVIAQEVNEVLPQAVTYAEDVDEYGVAYGNIVGLLIEAIKEQSKEIEILKEKVSGLN